MPTCPKCGSPRVDRYCAYCGASAVHPQAVAAPRQPVTPARPRTAPGVVPPQKKASWAPFVVLLLVVGGVVGALATLVSHRAEPVVTPVPAFAPAAPQRGANAQLNQFEFDADLKLAHARASLTVGSVSPSLLDNRVAHVKSEMDEVLNLRERLAAALRQARLEDHWPLRVAGVIFDRPSQLQKAIDSADAYLHRGSRIEADLVSASEQNRRVQASAQRTIDQMQQIRTDLHLMAVGRTSFDNVAMHDKRAKFAELNADLTQTLRDAPPVDWTKYDLPPFELKP